MITADDIRLLVSAGEGYNAEFKVSVPAKVKELSEEVCAFANAAGGTLLIGVNDLNHIVGVTIDNAKRSAIQNSLSEITPPLQCGLSLIDVDGMTVGAIEVPSGSQKPYVLSGAIYVRIGPNTQKLTTAEQMRDFFQQAERIYFDEVPCPGFKPAIMVDDEFVIRFKEESRIGTSVSVDQLFRNLKLYNGDNVFKNGAVLFFGKQPEVIMDKAIIRCIAFEGIDKRFILDDQPFGGNLYAQFQQALHWLRSKLSVRYDIESQGAGPRKEIWEIPETVFKETIINALAHRDYYDKGGVIYIEVYQDRVEITNPGGLVSAIPDAEFGKRSHSRNPLIFGLFARMHLVEQVGSGIGRIKDLMREAGLPIPIFITKGIFAVILSRPDIGRMKSGVKSRVKSRVKIIEMMQEKPAITIPELAEKIDVSKKAIEKQIAILKKEGLIERIGPDKGGEWRVIKK